MSYGKPFASPNNKQKSDKGDNILKNNQITQAKPRRKNCLNINPAFGLRSTAISQQVKSLLVIGVLIIYPGKAAWAAAEGIFSTAPISAITSSILLVGLSLVRL